MTNLPVAAPAAPPPQMDHYRRWLRERRGLDFADYAALWRWSVADLETFWRTIWDYFEIASPDTPGRGPGAILAEARMPGARWFPDVRVNYTAQILRHAEAAHAAGCPAIVWADETMFERGELAEVSWPELKRQVGALALALRGLGVQRGDRVAVVLPNAPQTVACLLACAAIGAIWSLAAPDMGPVAILDRFSQIEPKAFIGCDGYPHGGRWHDRREVMQQVLAGLPGVSAALHWQRRAPALPDPAGRTHHDLTTLLQGPSAGFEPEWVPFDHPLWIVYSSGTTGLPKPIVHGQGGIVIEALKGGVLHNDLGASATQGDRIFWNSSTTWIVWNGHVNALLGGTTICLFEGNASGRLANDAGERLPADWSVLWRFAAATRSSYFGAGSAFFAGCEKAGVRPSQCGDLSALRAVGATGSPLTPESFEWLWRECPRPGGEPIWLSVISGGTDVAAAFVGGVRGLPMVAGQMQAPSLGVDAQSWSEPDAQGRGRPLVDEVGELVIVQPMPSMPLYFWNDPDGTRYHDSYYDHYPGVWRHGDWIRFLPDGQSIIYGRSDATINRHGVRMGTAELYRAVEALPEVLDSMVVDLEYLGRESWMALFVVLREELVLDAALVARMKAAIRSALSPRHVPDDVFQVPAIPRTLSGKKMELPIKKLLLGAAPEAVLKRDAMANADSVAWFVDLAEKRRSASR